MQLLLRESKTVQVVGLLRVVVRLRGAGSSPLQEEATTGRGAMRKRERHPLCVQRKEQDSHGGHINSGG